MIRLHDLKPDKGAHRKRRRVARGVAAGQGMTAGTGTKGQGSRKNGTKGPYFEGGQLPFVRRLPFKRGFNNLFKIEYQEVGLALIARNFAAGDTINPETLFAKGLIRDMEKPIAILGVGAGKSDIPANFTYVAHRFSGPARTLIETAGGSVRELALSVTGARATIKLQRKSLRAKPETK